LGELLPHGSNSFWVVKGLHPDSSFFWGDLESLVTCSPNSIGKLD